MDHYGGVYARFEYRDSPERITIARVHADHAAIAGGGIKHSLAAEPAEVRMRIGIILGPVAGTGGPDELAGLFHERMMPLRFSVGIEARQNPLRALHENVARLRINGWAGDRVTAIH